MLELLLLYFWLLIPSKAFIFNLTYRYDCDYHFYIIRSLLIDSKALLENDYHFFSILGRIYKIVSIIDK